MTASNLTVLTLVTMFCRGILDRCLLLIETGGRAETEMTNDALIEEINGAYRQLTGTTEALARAERSLAEHVRRIRLDNAEAILEAKNERTASLYLDGLLDTDEHRRLEAARVRAELDHQHARHEVDRLQLIVRLLGATEGRHR